MNIYIVTRENLIGGKAGASRVRCYAKAIISGGICCKVLLIKQSRGNGVLPIGEFENIPYLSMGTEISTKKTDITRYISYLKDDFSLCKYLEKNLKSGDVVFEYGATIFHTFLLINIAHKKGAKFVRDLCEYPFGTQKESIFAKTQRWILLNYQFKRYDGVVSISDSLFSLAKKYCSKSCQIIKVPILVEYKKYSLEDLRHKADAPYIFHSGTLYEQKDGFVSMIDAFGKACQNEEFKMNFVTTGNLRNSPHATAIDELIHKYKIEDRVLFTGYLSSHDLCVHLQKASVVIINKYENQQNTFCFSTKLAEYLAAGKSVIITRVGEAMNWLTNGTDSYIIEPNDKEVLVNAILEVCNNNKLQSILGKNARQTCKDSFDYKIWSKPLCDFFQNLYSKL